LKMMALASRNNRIQGQKRPMRRSLSGNMVSGGQKSMFDRSYRKGRRDGSPF
jgi:hypothetical protein